MVTAEDEDSSIRSALATLDKLLTSGETVEAWATQNRIFALTHRRIVLVASTGRFIALTRRLIGGYDTADIRWQDLKETHIRAGLFGADITLVAQTSSDLNISAQPSQIQTYQGLRKEQAQNIYRICQQHDQAWREKRRVRELEELRAKSGGVQFAASGPAAAPEAANTLELESTRRLRQAREMLDAKLISDSEYEAIKAKIVSAL
jgi:hypothetical protein